MMETFAEKLAAALTDALATEPPREIVRADPHDFDPDLRPAHVREAEKAAKRKATTARRDPAECW